MRSFIILILISLTLSGCVKSDKFGGELATSKVDTEMKKQKIKPEFKKEIDNDIQREYHHYQLPNGEIGYTVIETKEEDGVISQRAYDPTSKELEKSRYYDWKIIKDNKATTPDEKIN